MTKKAKADTPKVFLTDRAISDLLMIEAYSISKWGKRVAAKYIGKFEKAFKLLEVNPELLLANDALGDSIQFYRVEKHLLACVKTKPGAIVLTIVHANRDLVPLIHELLPSLNVEVSVLLNKTGKIGRTRN